MSVGSHVFQNETTAPRAAKRRICNEFPRCLFCHVANQCQALSEFADYVEKQQKLRYPSSASATTSAIEDHAELDILDSLDLSDNSPVVKLKELLLINDNETLEKLVALLATRIAEGHGETVFEIGFENNGDSMGLTKDEWDIALKQLREAAKKVKADCQVLLTKHVGGDEEAESAASEKDKVSSGKVLVRQRPATVEDVIETRMYVPISLST